MRDRASKDRSPGNPVAAAQRRQIEVAICGNPNCGKTTIFNGITGLRQRVGNYPGVTVEKIFGQFQIPSHPGKDVTLVDIPGSYSLSAFSPDEYIAARALFGNVEGSHRPDVIVCIIDATNLERGLYLLFQVMQIGCPMVVGLNMTDLAKRHGTAINTRRLSHMLGGVPVVSLVGSRGKGIDRLKSEIGNQVDRPEVPEIRINSLEVEKALVELKAATNGTDRNNAELLRVLFDVGGPAENEFLDAEGRDKLELLSSCRKKLTDRFGSLAAAETVKYSEKASEIAESVIKGAMSPEKSRSEMIDRALLHPIFGPIILVVLMTLMFQSIFTWAEPVMSLVDTTFTAVSSVVEANMADGPLRSLLINGVIGGVGSVLIFLPQIMILFLFISILEDSGYMPRAAFLVDRAFSWCGLSGKSFIPMLSSFACAIPGILATRTIEDRKLRLITIMVAPLMTCSARLPVYTIMIAAFIPHTTYLGIFNSQGLVLTALYLLGIIAAVFVSYVLKKTLLRAERGTFMMDMPSYKMPSASSIAVRVLNRAKSFVLRAGTVILAITIIIWALGYYPHSDEIGQDFQTRRAAVAAESAGRVEALTSEIAALTTDNQELVQRASAAEDDFATAATMQDVEALSAGLLIANPEDGPLINLLVQRRLVDLEKQSELSSLGDLEAGAYLRDSYFSRIGQFIEPAFRPLGWDWKITMAVLSAFPAREVVIATLGTTFNLGTEIDEESTSLVDKMRQAKWDDPEMAGKNLFTPAVALSIMVFFALSCQCGATVVVIRQESGRWLYSALVFGYMTILAYIGALVVNALFTQVGL